MKEFLLNNQLTNRIKSAFFFKDIWVSKMLLFIRNQVSFNDTSCKSKGNNRNLYSLRLWGKLIIFICSFFFLSLSILLSNLIKIFVQTSNKLSTLVNVYIQPITKIAAVLKVLVCIKAMQKEEKEREREVVLYPSLFYLCIMICYDNQPVEKKIFLSY